ncbi:MAG: hypothetical protein IJ242_03525, partial [Clostridia bacterium]|nr:hypothetical protein [Clostridia bacterium]
MIIPNGFSPGATRAYVQAQISAAGMGLSTVGTGHLLVGLAKVDSDITKELLGEYDVRMIESMALRCYGRGDVGVARVTGMSPHLHRVTLRSMAYINSERRTSAGTVHMWQELLMETGCHAHDILHAMGREIEQLKSVLVGTFGYIERPKAAAMIPASDQ